MYLRRSYCGFLDLQELAGECELGGVEFDLLQRLKVNGQARCRFLDLSKTPHLRPYGRMKRFVSHRSQYAFDAHFASFVKEKHPDLYQKFDVPLAVKMMHKDISNESVGDFTTLPVKFLPAQQNDEAAYIQLGKFGKEHPELPDSRAWRKSLKWMKRMFYPWMSNSEVMTKEQVLEHFKSTGAAKKSPGVLQRFLYEDKESYIKSESGSRDYARYKYELLHQGGGFTVWGGNLKDELRPVEKVLNNKTRLFIADSVNHAFALDELCLDMNIKLINSRHFTWSTMGMSRYGGEFDSFYKSLERFAKKVWETDGSGWDASMSAMALWDIAGFRYSCLKDKSFANKMRMANLYREVIYSFISMTDGSIWRKFNGNPSGSVNTGTDNTMHHLRLLSYAFIVKIGGSYNDFISWVNAGLCGDDNIVASDSLTAEMYRDAVKDVLELTTTDWAGHHVSESCYCSQKVTKFRGRYVPVPDFEKQFHSMLYGCRVDSPGYSLLRAAGLRVHCWFEKDLVNILEDYKVWFLEQGFPRDSYFDEALDAWLTPLEITNIYWRG